MFNRRQQILINQQKLRGSLTKLRGSSTNSDYSPCPIPNPNSQCPIFNHHPTSAIVHQDFVSVRAQFLLREFASALPH